MHGVARSYSYSGYSSKYGFLPPQISSGPKEDLKISIVIPCFNEKDLIKTLSSIVKCEIPSCAIEVLVIINSSENADKNVIEQNLLSYNEALRWSEENSTPAFNFHILNITGLPVKHAGVGLARKIGMDEAASRFHSINYDEGIVVCLDADCTVEENYLMEIFNAFKPAVNAASIYYEHPVTGNEFANEIYEAIIDYELYLRYYNQGLRYTGYPYAYHTIGSSMAVRSKLYMQEGGMNKRKAGEDFYFLHKIIPKGNFVEINTTAINPSPRISDRVPFGTGNAVGKIIAEKDKNYEVYHPQIFIDLKIFLEMIPGFYEGNKDDLIFPACIGEFLLLIEFENKLNEIKKNVNSQKAFIKRFYDWMDGFMILKYVHFARNNFYGEIEIMKACKELLMLLSKPELIKGSKKEMLQSFRMLDRKEF